MTIVEAEPGVTRDPHRNTSPAGTGASSWSSTRAAWEQALTNPLSTEVVRQTEEAIATADVVVQIVDGTVSVLEDDERVARALRRGGDRDTARGQTSSITTSTRSSPAVTFGSVWAIPSASPRATAAGVEALLDAIVRACCPTSPARTAALIAAPGTPHVAIIEATQRRQVLAGSTA